MLGMFSDFTPKFVKKYENLGERMNAAFKNYIDEVGTGIFPSEEHGFRVEEAVLAKLY